MRVGWLVDEAAYVGGAELTQAEFRAAAPEGVDVVDCPAGEKAIAACDRYVIHNCVTYTLDDLEALEGKPTTKYWHDIGPWLQPAERHWLRENTRAVCCSPVQADHLALDATLVPPALDLTRFTEAAAAVNGQRQGVVSVAQWRNHGKAPHKVGEWAEQHGPVDIYGDGAFAPPTARPVDYEHMPGLLASYETFVYLPTVLEPFGRCVAEAWAAGCEVVTNNLVGALYWVTEKPEALETAGADFWRAVLA